MQGRTEIEKTEVNGKLITEKITGNLVLTTGLKT